MKRVLFDFAFFYLAAVRGIDPTNLAFCLPVPQDWDTAVVKPPVMGKALEGDVVNFAVDYFHDVPEEMDDFWRNIFRTEVEIPQNPITLMGSVLLPR